MGIVTAIVAGFIISALSGSRVQIGGPTAAFIPIILLIISEHGYPGLLMATIMAGIILILLGLTGLGSLVKYIPWPVTSGFTSGIAVSIILAQVPYFGGMQSTAGPMPREFMEKLGWISQQAHTINAFSLGLALACLATILLWPRLKLPQLPGSIVAVLLGAITIYLLG